MLTMQGMLTESLLSHLIMLDLMYLKFQVASIAYSSIAMMF